MNELISQQLPVFDAGHVARPERHQEQYARAVPAVAKTDRTPVNADAAEKRESSAGESRELSGVVEELNNRLQNMQRSLRFSVDDSSGRIIVKVVDLDTDEVIRQIPSEDMMAIIRNAGESQGVVFDEEV